MPHAPSTRTPIEPRAPFLPHHHHHHRRRVLELSGVTQKRDKPLSPATKMFADRLFGDMAPREHPYHRGMHRDPPEDRAASRWRVHRVIGDSNSAADLALRRQIWWRAAPRRRRRGLVEGDGALTRGQQRGQQRHTSRLRLKGDAVYPGPGVEDAGVGGGGCRPRVRVIDQRAIGRRGGGFILDRGDRASRSWCVGGLPPRMARRAPRPPARPRDRREPRPARLPAVRLAQRR